jgi:hypothetical protein
VTHADPDPRRDLSSQIRTSDHSALENINDQESALKYYFSFLVNQYAITHVYSSFFFSLGKSSRGSPMPSGLIANTASLSGNQGLS